MPSLAKSLSDASAAAVLAASMAYTDQVKQGLDPKDSVRAISTSNITLGGAQTIDGVSIIAGDRVLVAGQSTGANNGIYVCADGSWTRAVDADSSAKVTAGMYVPVTEGTLWADSGWILATNDPITLGSTALVFSQFFGTGVVQQVGSNTSAISALQAGQTAQDAEIVKAKTFSWTWANAAARTAQSVSAADEGAVGKQTDMALKYELLGVSPTRWGVLPDPAFPLRRAHLAVPGSPALQSNDGLVMNNQAGTLAARSIANTNASTMLARLGSRTAASPGSGSVYASNTAETVWFPGGCRRRMVVMLDVVSTNFRWFAGVCTGYSSSNVDPNTFFNMLAIGSSDASDTSLQLYHNDGSGTATKINLASTHSLTLPARTANEGYILDTYSLDGTSYSYQVTRINTGEVCSGILVSNIPSAGVRVFDVVWSQNNTDSVAVGVDFSSAELWAKLY